MVGTMDYFDTTSLGTAADLKKGKTTIRKRVVKFYNFCKGGNDSLKSLRRETPFIQILEGLHPLDAEILCLVKDKPPETKYKITKEIVSEAYLDVHWGRKKLSVPKVRILKEKCDPVAAEDKSLLYTCFLVKLTK